MHPDQRQAPAVASSWRPVPPFTIAVWDGPVSMTLSGSAQEGSRAFEEIAGLAAEDVRYVLPVIRWKAG